MHSTYNLFPCTCKCENHSKTTHISRPNTMSVYRWRVIGMTPYIWRMFLSLQTFSLFSKASFQMFHALSLQAGTVTLRIGIGSLLDDSKYLNNVTETMPLSQQLSGLLEKSVSVKASQPKCTIYFFWLQTFSSFWSYL